MRTEPDAAVGVQDLVFETLVEFLGATDAARALGRPMIQVQVPNRLAPVAYDYRAMSVALTRILEVCGHDVTPQG